MKFRELLKQSKKEVGADLPLNNKIISFKIFDIGCRWMYKKLNENIEGNEPPFNKAINYTAYGMLKYSIAMAVFLFSCWQFYKISFVIVPVAIIMFYLVEIHFLFLFPLILDGAKNPIWTSIRQTYKTGILKALLTITPIGFFMLLGLLHVKNPLRNWYIGCFAIIIWYKNEVRNRV